MMAQRESQQTAPSAQPHVVTTRAKLLVLTAVMASLLEIIDTSIVNVAVPTMMGNLGATLDEISWVITGYIIANAIVLPIAGWLSEQLGRKRYYTGAILVFTAASVACGLAPNLTTLVIFRIIQGFAGGALLPTSQALIYEAFPREKAGMASAIFGMSVMIGPTIGPTLGGYLTDNLGWRSIFNVNLPIGLVVAMLSYLLVEDVGFDPAKPQAEQKPRRQRTPVDLAGLILLVVGIGCLQFVLERGEADDWFDSTRIIICSILAVVGIFGLIWWELRAKHPILELHHFRNLTFRAGVTLMAVVGMFLFGLIFVIPIFVSTVQGLTATQTGELFIPGALASAFMMPFIGNQLRKRDARILVFVGLGLAAFGTMLIGRFDSATSKEGMFWPLLIRGAALAYLFVPINTVVLTQFTGAAIGQAAGMLNLCRQIGGSIGIALLATFFQRFQEQSYASLITHVTPFDPIAVAQSKMIGAGISPKLAAAVGLGATSTAVIKILYLKVKKEAFVIAFQKVVHLLVVGICFSPIPLYYLKAKPLGQSASGESGTSKKEEDEAAFHAH